MKKADEREISDPLKSLFYVKYRILGSASHMPGYESRY